MVFHELEQRVDRLAAEVYVRMTLSERVSLIYEQNTVQRRFNNGLGLQRGLTNVAPHKSRPVNFHQMAFGEESDAFVNAGEDAGHSSLPCARIPREHKVQRHWRHWQLLRRA